MRLTISVLYQWLALLLVGPLLAQDSVIAECRALPRPALQDTLGLGDPDRAAVAEVYRWQAHLTLVEVVGLEDGIAQPDPRADSLKAELRAYALRDSAGFRRMLLTAVRANVHRGMPELVANEAAVWYRHSDGRAGPVLAAVQGTPSDSWLIPLSAINERLTPVEEDLVARVACDVGLPLLVARRDGALPPGGDPRYRLDWVDRSERILRHAERLVLGRRRPLVAALIAGVAPTAEWLDPKRFGGPT